MFCFCMKTVFMDGDVIPDSSIWNSPLTFEWYKFFIDFYLRGSLAHQFFVEILLSIY